MQLLSSIAKICNERNIKLVLVTLPGYKTYRDNISPKQYELSHKTINAFVATHKNCVYLDYFAHDAFNIEDFFDGDHLNESGAKKVSLVLNKTISQ